MAIAFKKSLTEWSAEWSASTSIQRQKLRCAQRSQPLVNEVAIAVRPEQAKGHHYPIKVGGRSKWNLAIRRPFEGVDVWKCKHAFFFHRLYCKISFSDVPSLALTSPCVLWNCNYFPGGPFGIASCILSPKNAIWIPRGPQLPGIFNTFYTFSSFTHVINRFIEGILFLANFWTILEIQ